MSAEHIDVLLTAAVAAPSMHNTQPWRFEVSGHVIDLFLDGSRTLPAEDPTGRAMRIAAGAATFNLRCAAASLGYGTWLGEPEVHAVLDLVLDSDLREIHDWHRRAERARRPDSGTARRPVAEFLSTKEQS
ncbi:hypothetical protein E0H73_39720 [Kribbella pittospori]|uniref:Nitroreductase domain-containing protein n=1 Tax=Kribbella pittospori TaxID=722689 RepID=A0A4R0K2S9_9ACTN|nr:hypothetical protein E0H73_39720 [Kribbella pittospori]